MCRLQGSRCPRPAQIDDVDRAAARHKHQSLIGGRIDSDAPKQSERARQSGRTGALQSDLDQEHLLTGGNRRAHSWWGVVWICDTHGACICFGGIVQFTSESVALAAYGI